jgi:hypothetical protein
MKTIRVLVTGMLLGALALGVAWWKVRAAFTAAALPDPPALVEKVKEIARLETLEVHLSKTVGYVPDPPVGESFVGQVLTWVRTTVAPREGRALVYATVHVGIDVNRLDSQAIRRTGDVLELVLPNLVATVELEPERTEILRSNLDAAQTAELFAKAKRELGADVDLDRGLHERARAAAEASLRRFLLTAGFREVRFSPTPTPAGHAT